MAEIKRIVWAVDPIAEDMRLQVKCSHILKTMLKATQAEIDPVFVLSPDQLKMSSAFFPAQVSDFRVEAEKRLSQYLKKVKIPNVKVATVLVSNDLSLRSAVHALISYAKSHHSDMIVCSTMARKGMSRFLLGSFAETLIMQSDIPVLLVSPKTVEATKFKEILVPTDFSDKSKETLKRVAALASQMGSKVVLFHQVEYLTQYTLDQFGAVPAYQKYVDDDVKQREQTGAKWCEELQARGVKAECVLNKKGSFAADAILAQAKKRKSSIIAMASQTGPVASVLLGSVCRQVIRAAQCPVWVIHPEGYKSHEAKLGTSNVVYDKGTVIL
ncbi:MAG: universal stress protein [Deltaproteobacteria bacterium]|nr:universal stress protein [Deltaproteobacteria bacterium]MBI3294559.1 universal stress protein [Deltaproteobacteria bacterium]